MANLDILQSNMYHLTNIIENTDQFGLSNRMAIKYENKLFFLTESEKFLWWNGKTWENIKKSILKHKVREVIEDIHKEINEVTGFAKIRNGEFITIQDLLKYKKKISKSSAINGTIDLLPTCKDVAVNDSNFDQITDHITVQNGILNLRTGELRAHDPAFKSTRIVTTHYIKDAVCPKFIIFMNEISKSRPELVEYLQVLLGYLFTGITVEQKLFIFFGQGANGKSTLLNLLLRIAGGYGMTTPASTLLKKSTNSIPCDLPRLKNAWLVVASESNIDAKLDEAIIKILTGGEQIVARNLFENFQSFKAFFKIVFASNILPDIRGCDHGIKRRIEVIPFERTFGADELDKDLEAKLTEELPGIFAWIVQGAIKYFDKRLMKCKAVQEATRQYREEMDTVENFLEDVCDLNRDNDKFRVSVADLWQISNVWADKNGIQNLSKKELSGLIMRKGFRQGKSGVIRQWIGIKPKSKLTFRP